jgi:hypothetical protein
MEQEVRCCASQRCFEQLRVYIPVVPDNANMGKADRKALVLGFLTSTQLALPPSALYRNLRLRCNATFSESSLENYLAELEADGLVRRVDPKALADREIKEVADGRAYWLVTDAGEAAAPDGVTEVD